jgi:hypothetical protein
MKTFGLISISFAAGSISMIMCVRKMFKTMGEQL